jgi:hypothetical protein
MKTVYIIALSVIIFNSFAAGMYFQDRISWAKDTYDKVKVWLDTLFIMVFGLVIFILFIISVPFVRLYKWIDPGNQAYGWFKFHILRKKIATDFLRDFYKNNKLGPNWRKAISMYRRRNIRIASKRKK